MRIDSKTRQNLVNLFGQTVRFNEPMAKHTSLRVGGPAAVYSIPDCFETLVGMIQWCRESETDYMIIGGGTNLLIKDEGLPGAVISLARCLNGIKPSQTRGESVLVTAMAGTRLRDLCAHGIEKGLSGMNFALGIPGTVGGGIMMNAGTSHGWIEGVLEHIEVLCPNGQTAKIDRENIKFGYRSLSWENGETSIGGDRVIISGCFALSSADPEELRQEAQHILQERNRKQPIHEPSAGCFFKNPVSGKPAGELIDMAGLKGKQIGGAAVSEKHANFLINRGNASAKDFLELMTLVQKTISDRFNVDLETEVKIAGL